MYSTCVIYNTYSAPCICQLKNFVDSYIFFFQKFMPTLSPSDVMDHPFLDVAADTSAGYHSVATNDSIVQQAAIFVANQFNLRKDEDELFVLGRVTSSLSQVILSFLTDSVFNRAFFFLISHDYMHSTIFCTSSTFQSWITPKKCFVFAFFAVCLQWSYVSPWGGTGRNPL